MPRARIPSSLLTRICKRSLSVEDIEDVLELDAQILDGFELERATRLHAEFSRSTILFDPTASAFDRVFLVVKQVLDEQDELDFAALVDSIPRTILGRIQKAELTLPVSKHVRFEICQLAHIDDRKKFR